MLSNYTRLISVPLQLKLS